MATARKPPANRTTKPKANQETVAMAIAASKLSTVADAARKFKLSAMTITRYIKEIEDGINPELLTKVKNCLASLRLKNKATLDSLFQLMIDRLSELTPKASYDQVLSGAEKISEIKLTTDRFSNIGNNGKVNNDRSNTAEGSQMGQAGEAVINTAITFDSHNN